MIFFIVFALWIIFNGKITLEICLIGLVLSAALFWFSKNYLGYNNAEKGKGGFSLRRLPYLVEYLGILIWEVIKANVVVIRLTLAKDLEFEPTIIYFKTDLKEQASKVMLANSITLTPGTITVSLEGDTYCVHCLDKSMGEGIEESIFVQKLRRIEEV